MDSKSAHPNHNGTQMLALYEMDISKSDTPLGNPSFESFPAKQLGEGHMRTPLPSQTLPCASSFPAFPIASSPYPT